MEDIIYYNELYDLYGELLTDKQKEYFENYYFNNFSLSEMAENYDVSRNAVFDQIKKVINILEEYEEKLKVFNKSVKIEEFATKLDADLSLELLSIIKEWYYGIWRIIKPLTNGLTSYYW